MSDGREVSHHARTTAHLERDGGGRATWRARAMEHHEFDESLPTHGRTLPRVRVRSADGGESSGSERRVMITTTTRFENHHA
jgi:hypothetical protein